MKPKPSNTFIGLFCLLALTFCYNEAISARETLRVAAWAGYADADLVDRFQQRFDADIEVTFVGSDDDLWDKINSAGFDVFAVNTAELQRYIENDLVVPLDLANIPNHAAQLPRFQNPGAIPGLLHDGKLYAIPYTYAEMGLIYNRKLVKEIPQSMAAMWDPRYRGQVLAFNASNHNFSLVGLLMGADPFQLTDEQLRQAARELVRLRRNVLTFYSTADEAAKLFSRHDIALIFGNYGNQQVKALREAGADIGYVIPREGALAWLDCWAITQEAKNKRLAEQWINYTLERAVSQRLTDKHGLANTITPFPEERHGDKIIWLEPMRAPLERKRLWDRIISGEAPEAF
ncbi:extracellular solute-binding protein [Methylomonas rapida]|uniref:Extracellular solute-binding protein n=1 Tax=Methylomonas rapida TaxID=2963939 RepID=A0ABY7GPE0_9GAMM|nr:extracellular solute-binding protein [Methylomonas rapida]WAR46373.1 extracellular solute-binding protein [Methylomonas rapida]